MAEEVKPDAKNADDSSKVTPMEFAIYFILGALVVSILLNKLVAGVGGFDSTVGGSLDFINRATLKIFEYFGLLPFAKGIAIAYVVFVSTLSIFFMVVATYASVRISQVWDAWDKKLSVVEVPNEEIKPKNARWHRVVEHIDSDNPSNWRLAILEADIILDELLDELGYTGETLGEKLKQINSSRFNSLNSVWEAHKIRNAIAHEGRDFELPEREARRIIALYKQAFDEFDFV